MKSGLIAINVAAVLFGTAALYGKLNLSPLWIVAARGAFASVALIAFGSLRGGLQGLPSGRQLKSLLVTGSLLAIHWLTFFASVQVAGVAVATLTFAAFPLFTVLLESLRAGRRPSVLETGAGFAIVAAVALLVDAKRIRAGYAWSNSGPRISFIICLLRHQGQESHDRNDTFDCVARTESRGCGVSCPHSSFQLTSAKLSDGMALSGATRCDDHSPHAPTVPIRPDEAFGDDMQWLHRTRTGLRNRLCRTLFWRAADMVGDCERRTHRWVVVRLAPCRAIERHVGLTT